MKWMPPLSRPVTLTVALAVIAAAGCRKSAPEPRVVINDTTFRVEVATSQADLHQGLSDRRQLAADAGMLFVFARPGELTFHMKDCYFPIDLAFLDADRRIVRLETMAVEKDPAHPMRQYRSVQPAAYALETVGGTWERIGAQVGMTVTFLDVPGH